MYTGPNISDSGLILCLDAANAKSYVNGSTVWNDLSGNRNSGSLVNGPIFDSANLGSIIFDGINDYLDLGQNFNYTSESFTFCNWIYLYSLTSNKSDSNSITLPIVYKGNYAQVGYYSAINTSTSTVAFVTSQNTLFQVTEGTFSSQVQINTWYNIVITRSGSNIRIYINGLDKTSLAGTHINPASSNKNFTLGYYDFGGYSLTSNTKHSGFSIYNRALSPQEILQNYEGLKSRYGL